MMPEYSFSCAAELQRVLGSPAAEEGEGCHLLLLTPSCVQHLVVLGPSFSKEKYLKWLLSSL